MNVQLDVLDLQIVEALRENSRTPYQTIAEQTGVSARTVSSRADRLVEAGVIELSVIIHPAAIGYPVLGTVFIETEMGQSKKVAKTLSEMEEVAFVGLMAGDPDIYASIRMRSNEMLSAFMTDKLSAIPGIRKAKVLPLLKVLKTAAKWGIPTEIDGDPAYSEL